MDFDQAADHLREWAKQDIDHGDAAAVETVLAKVETLREHKRSLQTIVIFATESYAAVCSELGLSYEAEMETVLAAIRAARPTA